MGKQKAMSIKLAMAVAGSKKRGRRIIFGNRGKSTTNESQRDGGTNQKDIARSYGGGAERSVRTW